MNMQHIQPQQGEGAVEDVWAGNMEEAFATIRDIVVQFPYMGMVSILPSLSLSNLFFFFNIAAHKNIYQVFFWKVGRWVLKCGLPMLFACSAEVAQCCSRANRRPVHLKDVRGWCIILCTPARTRAHHHPDFKCLPLFVLIANCRLDCCSCKTLHEQRCRSDIWRVALDKGVAHARLATAARRLLRSHVPGTSPRRQAAFEPQFLSPPFLLKFYRTPSIQA